LLNAVLLVSSTTALLPSHPHVSAALRLNGAGRLKVSSQAPELRVADLRMAESDAARRKARRAARRQKGKAKNTEKPQEIQQLGIGDVPIQNLESASVGQSLPTFDDFRRRDEEREADATTMAAMPPTPTGPLGAMRDKRLELLSFDTIDDRPVDEVPYDWTARLIGRGLPNKAGAYILPYLQTGHILLVLVLLLSTNVSYPGFPLTEVPDEYRELLRQGFLITYVLNTIAAVYSVGVASAKEEPVWFWCGKVWLIGGLALGELSEAVPEAKPKRSNRR